VRISDAKKELHAGALSVIAMRESYARLERIPPLIRENKKTNSAEPAMQGSSETPARSGPMCPSMLPPIQAPMMPTIDEIIKPPGIELGTMRSARKAQAAATSKNKIKLKIPIFFLLRESCTQ
jgi:hypothetical protein